MKRLFKVKAHGNVSYFDNKMKAKAFRDEVGAEKVSRGPDHMGPHGTPGRKPWKKK